MAEVICPDNIQMTIEPDALLDHAMKMKKQGFRLAQACAAYVNKKFELSYSFADDSGTYQLTTLRIVIEPETEVVVRSIEGVKALVEAVGTDP